MRKLTVGLFAALSAFLLTSVFGQTDALPESRAGTVAFTFLQINDVYEIDMLDHGTTAGLARVETLRQMLVTENPNTYTFIAGDFFGPSAIGEARVDGARLKGRQMVDLLNELGLDYATFGNHEFDLSETDFLARMEEARFKWISGNVTDADGNLFRETYPTDILEVKNTSGAVVKVGLFGVTLNSNPKPYVRYGPYLEAARESVAALRPKTDIVVGLTHLDQAEDIEVATSVEGIALIMGGHEHENMQLVRGKDHTVITKADANALTAFVHRFVYATDSGEYTLRSELVRLDTSIIPDPEMEIKVTAWVNRAFAAFAAEGFDPRRLVTTTDVDLDGRAVVVRNSSNRLTDIMARAYWKEVPDAEAAFYNSGSIRIDDEISAGPLQEYDVLRINPFGGFVVQARMSGRTLVAALDAGKNNAGSGGFLQYANITLAPNGSWLVGGKAVDLTRDYHIATNDFLLTGREANLGFLAPDQGKVTFIKQFRDARTVLKDGLQNEFAHVTGGASAR